MKKSITRSLRTISVSFLIVCVFTGTVFCQKKYSVKYDFADKYTSYSIQEMKLKNEFENSEMAKAYIIKLPEVFLSKGFPVASVDSVSYDSTEAHVLIYLGEKFQWAQISTDSVDPDVLEITGWNQKQFDHKAVDFARLNFQQKKLLEYYENNGFPFAEVSLKNVQIKNDKIQAALHVTKGPLYHIDSIKIYGNVKIKNRFLQNYLEIENGSIYNNQKLQQINTRLQELPFLQQRQQWDVSMLGTGATLNVYLEPKRSSQVNVLVGFVPGNTITGKAQITADVHLDLKNTLASGESILFNWQQLQPQSPRLNLGYSQPYIFNSNFGVDLSFDLLKRDSSYLQINGILGLQYLLSSSKTFKIFYQGERNYLLSGGVDTNQIIASKRLPPNIDVSSGNLGIGYHFVNTNYRLNPRKGNEMDITATAGIRKTARNNEILNLKDPNDSFDFKTLYDTIKEKSYRFKIVASAAHFFPFGKTNTLKTAASIGLLQSPQTFQNEFLKHYERQI